MTTAFGDPCRDELGRLCPLFSTPDGHGITHCQARSQEKLDFHLNMSAAAVNLLRLPAQKAEVRPAPTGEKPTIDF